MIKKSRGHDNHYVMELRNPQSAQRMYVHALTIGLALVATAVHTSSGQTFSGPQSLRDAPTTPKPEINYRLPTSIKPLHYQIRLQPYMYTDDPNNFTTKGKVTIFMRCMEATDQIVLHSHKLNIAENSIIVVASKSTTSDLSVSGVVYDEDKEFYTIQLNKRLLASAEYAIEIAFTAPLEMAYRGLFLINYKENKQTKYMAVTHFEPTGARWLFPCFDEPGLKATFNITLVRKQDLISLSNMPLRTSSKPWTEDGVTYMADEFVTTPLMSTYLLAFAVADYTYMSTPHRDIEIRAYVRPSAKNFTDWVLESAHKSLDYFEGYFETNYTLPKLDMIGLPILFGAMENWGLVTFGEALFLYRPGLTGQEDKFSITGVTAHELAHMWFGDLVSPAWWNDLWLNEAFATFMANLAVDSINPELKIQEAFVVNKLQSALKMDGVIQSHPIDGKVGNPATSAALFDGITYGKGGSILRMLRDFLGYETFRKGLVRYIHKNMFGSATRDDLWEALDEQTVSEQKGLNVKDIMNTWLLQMNYPVVTVTRDVNDHGRIHMKQSRFLANPDAADPRQFTSGYGYKWTIPVTLTSSKNPKFIQSDTDILWVDNTETEKSVDIGADKLPILGNSTSGWILGNVGQVGFYRVNYHQNNWNALIQQLHTDHTVIPEVNRGQIIDDALNLAMAGLLDVDTAMKTTGYMEKELSGLPWMSSQEEINYMDDMLAATPSRTFFQRYIKEIVELPFSKYDLNFAAKTKAENDARKVIGEIACRFGVDSCTKEALRQYRAWMKSPEDNRIDPDMKSTVYCTALKHGNRDEWNFAFKMFEESNYEQDKAVYLRALACTEDPWIINEYLHKIMDPKADIRFRQAGIILNSLSKNPWGRLQAWTFFQKNMDFFKQLYSSNDNIWSAAPVEMIKLFNTELEISQVQFFLDFHKDKLSSNKIRVNLALDGVRDNIRWMKIIFPKIKQWLARKYNN